LLLITYPFSAWLFTFFLSRTTSAALFFPSTDGGCFIADFSPMIQGWSFLASVYAASFTGQTPYFRVFLSLSCEHIVFAATFIGK
jgi:hypothetical protein